MRCGTACSNSNLATVVRRVTTCNDIKHESKLLDEFGEELGIKVSEDWYKVSTPLESLPKQLKSIIRNFGSWATAIPHFYPQFDWKIWQFRSVPVGFWEIIQNQRNFFDWIADCVNIQQQEDWYEFTCNDIKAVATNRLLSQYYGSCLFKALSAVYPEFTWQAWRFPSHVPSSHWESIANQQNYFDWLAEQLNITNTEDWYKVSPSQLRETGGTKLLKQKYHRTSYLTWLKQKLHIQHDSEWKFVSTTDINRWKGGRVMRRSGGLLPFLSSLNPRVIDDSQQVVNNKTEFHLHRVVNELFPDVQTHSRFKHKEMLYPHSLTEMELDVYIPSLGLAFEYQGQQHFHTKLGKYGCVESQQCKDELKRAACARAGITLIEVPYWWDHHSASIAATIRMLRPDISFRQGTIFGDPIPATAPVHHAVPSDIHLPSSCSDERFETVLSERWM
jgi:hypothetical protein